MGLVRSIQRNITAKGTTIGSFSLLDESNSYIRNGFYGIHNALYGNQDRALSISAVFACVKIISEDVASLPLFTYENIGAGQRVAKDHPLYTLLHDAPNPDMTAVQFRGAVTAHALLCGKGYVRMERSRAMSDRIIAMWPMAPSEVREDRDRSQRPVFIWRVTGVPDKTLTQKDVFQLPAFGLVSNNGLNVLELMRDVLGLGYSQTDYAKRFFEQDQTPNLILKHPGKLTPEGVRGAKKAWANAGDDGKVKPQEWHAPKILQEGMDFAQLQPNAQNSQLLEQRSFQVLEYCRMFRMSPHKLADLGRATWGNVEQFNIQHYTETLRPWLVRWEQSLKLWCFGLDNNFYAEHEIGGMLRGDFMTQTQGFGTLLDKGVHSINEVRGLLNLNPIDGGDDHFIQLNMGTVQDVASGATVNSANGTVPIKGDRNA